MNSIRIENLSYDTALDRDALEAIAGSGLKSWLKSAWRYAVRYVKRNPVTVARAVIGIFRRIF